MSPGTPVTSNADSSTCPDDSNSLTIAVGVTVRKTCDQYGNAKMLYIGKAVCIGVFSTSTLCMAIIR